MGRRRMRKATLFLGVLLAFSLVAASCGGDDDEEGAGGEGGEFSLFITEPEHLAPPLTNESEGHQVLYSLFIGLVEYDIEDSEPINVIAESIESDDQQTWTIKIEDGWTFHDGTPVTASSFVDAWNYTAYAPNAAGNSYFMDKIEGYDDLQCDETDPETDACLSDPTTTDMTGLEVIDDTTFEVTLSEPYSQFPVTLGYTAYYPLPEAFFDDPEGFEEAPIGNGPFEMDGVWEHDQGISVKRYEDYKGEPAKADAVRFSIYTDETTGYRDVQAGNLDITNTLPPEEIESAKTEFGDRFGERPGGGFNYLGFPTYDERFQDPDLRMAMSMAIDRELITEQIFSGAREPAKGLVSPVVVGAREDPCGEGCEYDPEKAKELYDSTGGLEGTVEVWFNSGGGHEDWVEAVANFWRQNLGIEDIQFQSLEFAEYLPKLDNKEITGPFRLGWIFDYPSAENYLGPLYTTDAQPPAGSNNTFYSNEEVDDLIAEGNRAESIDDGIVKYQEAEDLILADMPNIPMFWNLEQLVHTENVENVQTDAFGVIRIAEVEVVS